MSKCSLNAFRILFSSFRITISLSQSWLSEVEAVGTLINRKSHSSPKWFVEAHPFHKPFRTASRYEFMILVHKNDIFMP